MGFASLTSTLVARKGQAQPSSLDRKPQSYGSDMVVPFATSSEESISHSQETIYSQETLHSQEALHSHEKGAYRTLDAIHQKIGENFQTPYTHADLKKITVRVDKRLLDAFRLKAVLLGVSQQDLFREAMERQLLNADWIDR